MITVCEECGRKYKLDPSRIKGKEAKFKCKSCGYVNIITKPESSPEMEPPPEVSASEGWEPAMESDFSEEAAQEWQPDFGSLEEGPDESGEWQPSFDSDSSESVIDDTILNESVIDESVIDESVLGDSVIDDEEEEDTSMADTFSEAPTVSMDTTPEPTVPEIPAAAPPPPPEPEPRMPRREKAPEKKKKKQKAYGDDDGKRGFGLRGKMTVLFLVIPIALMTVAGLFFLYQMNTMARVVTNQSSEIVKQLSEQMMAQVSRTVALQVGSYLTDHPFLKKEDFNLEMELKKLAVQKVGITGYTALYSLPDTEGVWRIWCHADPDLVGENAKGELQERLGPHFEEFWTIFTGVSDGTISRGYYKWPHPHGGFRDKFMVCTPIEGTPYVIMATQYVEEFTRDVKRLETRTGKVTENTRDFMVVILIVTIVVIGFIVAFYGARLTRRITALKEAADRISVGELDTEIDVGHGDEIGDLGDAIGRMQESIRLSIERLRRRRKR
ncbi:MAG: HAMP domain-containing protein [Desulfatibacillaceae bacterium]